MYDKEAEDSIRAQEIFLGNPRRHGAPGITRRPVADEEVLFKICIDYKNGTCEYIIPETDSGE